ncbi:nSTAND1 domain-containing NTPase [Phormidium nigroviride]
MNQPIPDPQSQAQGNLIQDTNVRGDLIFAPVQIGTKIETQIVQISVAKVTQQPLIKTSPYQGLKKFNFKDRERFFGRDKLIARLFEAVNRSNLSLVLGASGSGKSSIVRAGLMPELSKSLETGQFYDFIFTPNQDPFESLYRCLQSEEKDYKFSELEAKIVLEAKADTLPKMISTLKKKDERWLIFVDQFEELFTYDEPEKCKNFIEGIVKIANLGDCSVKILLAMRSDFLEQLSAYPDLGEIANQNNIHLMTEMYSDELRQAIEQPAARHGVVFEEGLVEQIIKEVEGQKGFLPLLQYTLNLLWETECQTMGADGHPLIESRTLNKASYAVLGGVRGALQKHINEVYVNLNQDGQIATKQVFLKLVSIVETDSGIKTVSRRAYQNEFDGESVNKILKKFINEKLLVSSSDSVTEKIVFSKKNDRLKLSGTIEIAHEILLFSWDVLKAWIEQEKEAIIIKNWLASETRRWKKIRLENQSKANDELLKGSRLVQVLELRSKNAFENVGGLRPEENEFITTSLTQRDRNRRRTILGLTSGLLAVSIFAVGAVWQWQRAEYQRQEVEKKQINIISQSSEQLLNSGRQFEAMLQILEAGIKFKNMKTQDYNIKNNLVTTLESITARIKEKNIIELSNKEINTISTSYDSKMIASTSPDNILRIWTIEGKLLKEIPHENKIKMISFHPKNKILLSVSDTIRLWDTEGKLLKTFPNSDEPIYSANFSSDGMLIIASTKNTVQLWTNDGILTRTINRDNPQELPIIIEDVKLSSSSKIIAIGGDSKTFSLYKNDGSFIRNLDSTPDEWILNIETQSYITGVSTIDFSPDEEMIASGNGAGRIDIFDMKGHKLRTLKGDSDDTIKSVKFSPDGQLILAGGYEGRVYIWNASNGELLNILEDSQENIIDQVQFSSNGQHIIACIGGKIKIWESSNWQGDKKIIIPGAIRVDFSSDHQTVASVSVYQKDGYGYAGTIWNTDNIGNVPWNIENIFDSPISDNRVVNLWAKNGNWLTKFQHKGKVNLFFISPNGKNIATFSEDENTKIKLWSIDGNFIKSLPVNSPINYIDFSYDNQMIASASEDQMIKIWNFKGEVIKTINSLQNELEFVKFAANNKFVVSTGGNILKIWQLDGRLIREISVPGQEIKSIEISPDNKSILTVSDDGSLLIHTFTKSFLITKSKGKEDSFKFAHFSPDGQLIAFANGSDNLEIWSYDGKLLHNLSHESEVLNFSFSSDGNMIATSTYSGTVRLWSRDGKLIKNITGPSPALVNVWFVQFSKYDGRLAIIGSRGGVVLKNFDLDNLLIDGCYWVGDYLKNNPNVSDSDRHLCDGISKD